MKKFIYAILALTLIFTGFVACSDDDDDDPIPIVYDMVVHNRATGVFYAVDLATGQMESVGVINFLNQPLTDIRSTAFDAVNQILYVSENTESYDDDKVPNPNSANGRIFTVNLETLEATVLVDNYDYKWYAISGMVMSNSKLLGMVYWQDYDIDYSTGLVWLNPDGSIHDTKQLLDDGEDADICCGMALEFGASSNQLITTHYDEILVADLNGTVSERFYPTLVGFPGGKADSHKIKSLAKDENGKLYGVNNYGDIGEINLNTQEYIHIATFDPNDVPWQALTLIPDTVFDQTF